MCGDVISLATAQVGENFEILLMIISRRLTNDILSAQIDRFSPSSLHLRIVWQSFFSFHPSHLIGPLFTGWRQSFRSRRRNERTFGPFQVRWERIGLDWSGEKSGEG